MLDLKRTAAVLFAALVLLPLSSCGGRGSAPGGDGEDLGKYVASHGRMCYTSQACVFSKGNFVYYLANDLTRSAEPLCFKPDCMHTDDSCSAYIGTPCIYSCGDKLYYIGQTRDARFQLFEMSLLGENRQVLRELPMLQANENGMGYTADIRSGYLALIVSRIEDGKACREFWLVDVGKPDSEPILVFSDDENAYLFLNIVDEAAYLVRFLGDSGKMQLISCSVKTGDTQVVVDDWARENCMTADGDMLYWYAPEEGFFSKDLTTGEVVKYRSADRATEYGAALYDDRYIYFTNAIPALDARDWVPEGSRGLTVYDRQGNKLLFVPSSQKDTPTGIYPEMVTEDAVLLFPVSGDNYTPKWYLKKSDIETGSAELIPIPGSGRPAGGGASN